MFVFFILKREVYEKGFLRSHLFVLGHELEKLSTSSHPYDFEKRPLILMVHVEE